ncbi:hypothetical protein C9374_012939 [Naegleria lovaniensis]|uniref:Protein YIPF3 n=1 Tax=Naegleria lovaniensis TaxID=51637 RepID=A0AA88KE74_NAELO|nr:uncharacterized protein C9374_012939 [Naegleria lovaniensis]KAG2372996.1 hypothetical protein C9374_012939 [Naegleria lovaniensis]
MTSQQQDWIESNFDEQLVIEDQTIPQQKGGNKTTSDTSTSNESLDDDFSNSLQFQFAKSMLQSTTGKVVPSWFSFGFLKPYFIGLDEKQALQRVIQTVFKPLQPMISHMDDPDLFIPLVTVFSLAILLDFQMKFFNVHVNEGTLLGTSLFSSFVYWIGSSAFFFVVGLVLGSNMSLISLLCITGYQLIPLCVIQFCSLIYSGLSHGATSNVLFYLLYFTLALSGSINYGLSFFVKTAGTTTLNDGTSRVAKKTNGMIMCGLAITIHMIYIFWVSTVFQAATKAINQAIGGDIATTSNVAQD